MNTPKTLRRPLASLAKDDPILNTIPRESSPERDLAYKASLNALIGKTATEMPISRRQSANNVDNPQETEVEVGDEVEVPGGMTGVVKYVGTVKGKAGTFAGVELDGEYASRGKNDGDVEGIRYFTTTVPGAGIFLPSHRAIRAGPSPFSASTFPQTPPTPAYRMLGTPRPAQAAGRTPATAGVSKFSQSVGPGRPHPFSQTVGPAARAPSPQLKPKSRPSLPRPESPFRKQPNLQPSTIGRGSVRGVRPSASSTPVASRTTSKPTGTPAGIRSPSRAQSRLGFAEPSPEGVGSPSPFVRPKSSMRTLSNMQGSGNNEEVQRLQKELEERDKQLKEQAVMLAEMESSLAEVQSVMATTMSQQMIPGSVEPGTENANSSDLRAMLKAKQDKIDTLTREFDKNRADFRSTIDTLEVAASTTETIYEQKIQDLTREIEDLQAGKDDIEQFQEQYKQFEEAVAELEEAVESARRGEAEAKAESEFLHGEVERVRLELRREREKATNSVMGATAAVGDNAAPSPGSSPSREMESRDDQIRGLKSIIANLTAGADISSPLSKPSNLDTDTEQSLNAQVETLQLEKTELKGLVERKTFREEELEREVIRLRNTNRTSKDYRNSHQQAHGMPNGSHHPSHNRTESTATTIGPTMHPYSPSHNRHSTASNGSNSIRSPRSSYQHNQPRTPPPPSSGPSSPSKSSKLAKVAPMKELDTASQSGTETDVEGSQADTDSAWCELCEAPGHDILTCSKMFGTHKDKDKVSDASAQSLDGSGAFHYDAPVEDEDEDEDDAEEGGDETVFLAQQPFPKPPSSPIVSLARAGWGRPLPGQENGRLSPSKPNEGRPTPKEERPLPIDERPPPRDEMAKEELPAEGPAPGKESGKIDMEKWCAMCERDGHESVDCPFEEEY